MATNFPVTTVHDKIIHLTCTAPTLVKVRLGNHTGCGCNIFNSSKTFQISVVNLQVPCSLVSSPQSDLLGTSFLTTTQPAESEVRLFIYLRGLAIFFEWPQARYVQVYTYNGDNDDILFVLPVCPIAAQPFRQVR